MTETTDYNEIDQLEITTPDNDAELAGEERKDTANPLVEFIDIFQVLKARHKSYILIAGGLIALITPFTDTVYLPALTSVTSDFHTTESLTALTVSAYLGCIGIGQLMWGPLSDFYGRLSIMFGTLFFYEIFTIGCIFVNSIELLIVLRCIQGFIVGATMVSVQAIIADIYAPEERGAAMGAFLAPMLLGPILAPLVGGALTQAFGWRATFVLLAVMTLPISAFAYFIIPETHHYLVATESLKKPDSMIVIKNAENFEKPGLNYPWHQLIFLIDPELAPYYCSVGITFAIMFTSLTTLPIVLADSPYNLSPSIIGVCYLPIGFAMLLGSIFGGSLSDFGAAKYPDQPEGRMIVGVVATWLVALSSVAFGFAIGNDLSAVLITHFMIGLTSAPLMPCTLGYLSVVRQSQAAAASSVQEFCCFFSACVSVLVSISIADAIGYDYLFVLLAGLDAAVALWVSHNTIVKLHGHSKEAVILSKI